MILVLDLWQRKWQSVAFDPVKGRGRVRWLRRAPSTCAGWAFKLAGTWYAVWSDGKNLVFQSGAMQLPMTEYYQCRNIRIDATRKFTIEAKGLIVFEMTYKAIDRDNDPTFDELDLEMEDFFVWTTKLWNDLEWKQDMTRKLAGSDH